MAATLRDSQTDWAYCPVGQRFRRGPFFQMREGGLWCMYMSIGDEARYRMYSWP